MDEDVAPESTGTAAGVAVIVVVGSGILAGAWAAAPDIALLVLWALGAGSVWWAVRRPNKINIPSPPPPDDPSSEGNTQVRVISKDPSHPTRYIVEWVDTETEAG